MWTPKQLLSDKVVTDLRTSRLFPEVLIEFLGWNNGRARRLNASRNPVKAALTMLRDPTDADPNERTHYWLKIFFEKKRDSVAPRVETSMEDALALAAKIKNLIPQEEDDGFPVFAQSREQDAVDNE